MYRRQKTAVVGVSPFSSPPHFLSTALFKSSLFSLAARFRYKKIQDIYVNDSFLRSSDVAPCLTNSRSNMSPQPLPLPELGVLMRQDAAHAVSPSNNSANIRLPSPPSSKCREERDAHRHGNGDVATSAPVFGSKIASQDARRNAEHRESLASRRSPNKPGGAEKSPRNYRLNVPTSIPISSFSSPSLSPGNAGDVFTSHHLSPTGFQVWSAPELPPSDTILGPGHSYQHYEINAIGADNYPFHNPRLNFVQHSISPRGPSSPLNTKLPADTSTTRRDGNIQNNVHSNTQTNVHPLPLPPTASMASQPASSPNVVAKPVAAKPERMKGQWKKGKLIGRGTFGSVYVGSNRETGALCAMKEVEVLPDDPKSAECIRQLEQEIQVLSQLKHPNIVQYYDSETIGDRFYIYLEYVHPGSIVNYIRDHCGGITESIVRNFTRHILSGLAYLHSTKTIHRDIKGANLLVDAYGVVKLADFGMAKHLDGQAANLSLKGSPYWMAPELLQPEMQKDADPDLALAVDIWSLGCTIIEMMNGKPPWSEFEGAAAMFKVMRETPPIPETMSPEGKDFLCWCFRRNPAERPSASMLLEHRFMKNSQLLDVSLHNQALSGMKQMEKAHQLEHPKYKHDNVHVSTGAQSTKGKLSNSETDRKSSNETSELKLVPRRSLGSTMDAISSNPLGLGPHMDYPSPIAAAPGSIKPLVRVHRSQ